MGKIANIILVAVLFLFASCGDKGVWSTDYVITPMLMAKEKGDTLATTDVKAFIFYGDTVNWKVDSWEDALIGKITAKEGTETRNADFTAVPDADGLVTLGPITQETFMVLVSYNLHDEEHPGRMYAWRKATTLEDLPRIDVHVIFKPWQTKWRYTESKWLMVDDYRYVKPEEPKEPGEVDNNGEVPDDDDVSEGEPGINH